MREAALFPFHPLTRYAMGSADSVLGKGNGVTFNQAEESGEKRKSKPLWITILMFLPVLIFVAYILLVLIHGIDDIIRERSAG